MVQDIHNRDQREKQIWEKIEQHPELSQRNLNQIKKFIQQIKAEDASKDRIHNYLWSFATLASSIDFNLDQANREDLVKLVGKINNNELQKLEKTEKNGEIQLQLKNVEYGAYSKAEFRKTLSKMYRAFYNEEKKIDFITTDVKKKNRSKLKAEELPKPEHIKELVKTTRNSRDEALIMTLWDTGGRIEAVLNLKWKNFSPSDQATIRFSERNKTMLRKIPVAESVPSLKKWSEEHPNPEPEEYIFTKYEGNKKTKSPGLKPVKYSTVYGMLKRIREKTDLPEKVKTNPHAFRKSRATFLAASGMNVNMLAKFMGWNDITTAEKYVSLAQNQLTSSFKKAVGIEDGKSETGLEMDNEVLKPGRCESCDAIVSRAWTYCYNCNDTITGDNLLTLLEQQEEEGGREDTIEQLKSQAAKMLKRAEELEGN